MQLEDTTIKDILLKESYVSEEDLTKAETFCRTHRAPLVEYLLSEGLITQDLLGQAIAEHVKAPYVDLNTHQPAQETVLKLPEEIAKQFHAVVHEVDKSHVGITTDQPQNDGLKAAVAAVFPKATIRIGYSLPQDVDAALAKYRHALDTRFSKIIEEQQRVAPEIIEEIIEDALLFRASDIHFEPQSTDVLIRFRVDGVLQDAGRIPKPYYESVLNRVKVQSHLRIDEHFSTQDGAMRHESQGVVTDVRVSIAPTIEGEKVVMRLLSQYMRRFTLTDLGLSNKDQHTLSDAFNKPFGMILVTGPTGSGKSTTLYAALKELNTPDINITTIEDPVEYKIGGVNQIQVNMQTNITFAKGLRAIVRQDPDVILVGEIRDQETAEIAVNAALTGHLLLSTFHANDAATAFPRLLDMDIEPFLLASTLELVVAQRLVRRICENCRLSYPSSTAEIGKQYPQAKKFFNQKTTLFRGKGCDHCNHTGYHGRMAIFEMIEVTPEMQELILTRPSSQDVWKLARSQGASTLFEDGIEKVNDGITTLEELLRVAAPPKN